MKLSNIEKRFAEIVVHIGTQAFIFAHVTELEKFLSGIDSWGGNVSALLVSITVFLWTRLLFMGVRNYQLKYQENNLLLRIWIWIIILITTILLLVVVLLIFAKFI